MDKLFSKLQITIRFKREEQVCKPGSVTISEYSPIIYLGLRSPAASNDLPMPASYHAVRHGASSSFRHLFGLSTHKVFRAFAVTGKAVVSYTTFSPLPRGPERPRTRCGGIFSVVLSVSRRSPAGCLPVRKYGALCCPDFPPYREIRR